jgi:hypothetical protein
MPCWRLVTHFWKESNLKCEKIFKIIVIYYCFIIKSTLNVHTNSILIDLVVLNRNSLNLKG